jgi:hypothetical protein
MWCDGGIAADPIFEGAVSSEEVGVREGGRDCAGLLRPDRDRPEEAMTNFGLFGSPRTSLVGLHDRGGVGVRKPVPHRVQGEAVIPLPYKEGLI